MASNVPGSDTRIGVPVAMDNQKPAKGLRLNAVLASKVSSSAPAAVFVTLNQWIIGPLQKGLALPPTAEYISGFAVGPNLTRMPGKCSPAFYLNLIN